MSWDYVFLSLYHVPLIQEQPTCWASNGNDMDPHLSNLSFAGLFETQSTNLAFNTLGTTKFDSEEKLHINKAFFIASASIQMDIFISLFLPVKTVKYLSGHLVRLLGCLSEFCSIPQRLGTCREVNSFCYGFCT